MADYARAHLGVVAVELLVLAALSALIGFLAMLLLFRRVEDVPLLLVVVALGVAGTTIMWLILRLVMGEAGSGLADWRHWCISLLAGVVLQLNVVLTERGV